MASKNRYHDEADGIKLELESELARYKNIAEELDLPQSLVELEYAPDKELLNLRINTALTKAEILAEHREREFKQKLAEEVERENKLPAGTLASMDSGRVPHVVSPLIRKTDQAISAFWEVYRTEKLADGKWKSNKISEGFYAHFLTFIELVGDVFPHEITAQVCIKYKDELLNYPRRRFIGQSGKKPLNELRNLEGNRLTLGTRNAHMTAISTFVDWLIQRELIAVNPFTAKKLIPRRDKRKEMSTSPKLRQT